MPNTNQTNNGWQDLTDDELRARLLQRGETESNANWLVARRDTDYVVEFLDDLR